METNELQAGRELDALIAEKVMGLPVVWAPRSPYATVFGWAVPEGRLPYINGTDCPNYSTDIAAAWQVVEKAIDYEAATTDYDRITGRPTLHRWELWFGTRGLKTVRCGRAYAPTAPLAICRAALKAVSEC